MPYLVVGTAGHIDHGKSALVHSLTGTDPDRLKEEKKRGITIELGFADLELGDGRVVSFVDVPGHERFVRHMVAGAAGVDAVLLVVAADQGVQPQTREHLDICRLLGIRRGIIALTKADLVDPELAEVVGLEASELCGGTFLEDAPLVRVSARTGEGTDALRAALLGLFETCEPRPSEGVTRLPVDRSFVLHGFGTVVTGTLVGGTLREGQEVEVLPGGKRGRVRGLQVHRSAAKQVPAGRRTAVNIQGLECGDVPRGATVSTPGGLLPTRRIWARLSLLPSAPEKLLKGGTVRFHQGTADAAARLRVFGRGDDGCLQTELFFREAQVLVPGDRFILRRPAPVDTLGGGVVMDVRPPRAKERTDGAFAPAVLERDVGLRLRLQRAALAGADADVLRCEIGCTSPEVLRGLAALVEDGISTAAGSRWFDREVWDAAARRLVQSLDRFHADQPLRSGLSREALRSELAEGMPQEAWREFLERLESIGEIRLAGDEVARGGHRVVLSGGDMDLAKSIEDRFLHAGLEPPALADVVPSGDVARVDPIVKWLVAEGTLVRIQDRRLFHSQSLEQLRAKLRAYATESKTIDVAAFKELAGVTRKNAIPLLEQLDSERSTRRVGNSREILLEPE
jgi:selenocysteine-specific elongation factor